MPISKALAMRGLTMVGVDVVSIADNQERIRQIADVFVKSVGKHFGFNKNEQTRLKLRILSNLSSSAANQDIK